MILNTNTRSLIVQAIRSLPEWFTVYQLSVATGGTPYRTLTSQLARMQSLGEIERGHYEKGLRKGKSFRYYRATERLGESVGKTYGVCYQAAIRDNCHNIFVELIERGHDEDFVHREPSESTHYPPGSQGKIEVMAARVGRGESPYHPNDVKVGASGHESDSGCEGLPAIRWVDTAATGRVLRKAIS